MKKGNPTPLTPELQAELDALAARPASAIDTSDMPEVTDWSGGVRGAFFRPIKKPIAMRLDADVLDWFKRGGEGYQTRINAALREFMERHRD
ncbi:MAG: BrnA antitoxin family protein [Alphaproteobacteria bacterium]|nr:BrnA antitoxin family protein [Alphaproteobacteria bacterium]